MWDLDNTFTTNLPPSVSSPLSPPTSDVGYDIYDVSAVSSGIESTGAALFEFRVDGVFEESLFGRSYSLVWGSELPVLIIEHSAISSSQAASTSFASIKAMYQ